MTGKFPPSLIIQNCYDSHVHWQATGQLASRLDLSDLTKPSELTNLNIHRNYFRGDWLLGFAWDDSKWSDGSKPHRKFLDHAFPGFPVKFFRADMHAAWVSTEALKRTGLFYQNVPDPDGGRIEKDEEGWPTGLLVDLAMATVDNLIPAMSSDQVHQNLLLGLQLFNRAGFTHIRDMTCDDVEWNQKTLLAESGALTLAVEQNFHCYSASGFSAAMKLALTAKQNHHPLLRPIGPKIFLDGALGSEGALISANYKSGSGRGILLIERIALKEIVQESWANRLQVSVHCIGDEAAHIAVTVACELWDLGHEGILNIEHAQMLRPQTIAAMKGRPIRCYMQPCHWMSDRRWLSQKIPHLFQFLFPWAQLEDAGIAVHFGSDAPIEPASVALSYESVADAATKGISAPKKDVAKFHSHPDLSWPTNTFTEFKDGCPVRLVFQGHEIQLNRSLN